MTLKVEVQLKDAPIEASLETVALRHLPLLVHNSEGDVFVGNPCTEANGQGVGRAILFEVELRCASLVREVRVEDVELVALDNLGRWILRVVMRLIVLVPFIALLDTVEESRLAHDEELLLRLNQKLFVGSSRVLSVY